MTRIIGLDPGLRHTGWGVIEASAHRLQFVACGTIDGGPVGPLAGRLTAIYDQLVAIIVQLGPAEAAIEETVVNVNASSSLKLGHARGVVVLAAARAGLVVEEYASKMVKRAVTGTGAAPKTQVAAMVRMLLPSAGDVADDAADALAVAICHAHRRSTLTRIAGATVGGTA